MTINGVNRILKLSGSNCSFANIATCQINVSYAPTVIVTNQTELNTQLAKTAAELEGQIIGVQYNPTPYVITRSGTPNLLNKAIGTGRLVLTQYGAKKPVFSRIEIDDSTNITLDSLELYQNVDNVGSYIALYDNCWGITINSCVIHGKYYDPNGDYSASGSYPQNSLGMSVSLASGKYLQDLTIRNNTFYNLRRGHQFGAAGSLIIEGNTYYNFYEDPIAVNYTNGNTLTRVNWNTMYNPIGLASDAVNPHFDFIQLLDPGGVVTWTVEIIGNIGFIGNARGNFQGIFCNLTSSNSYIAGEIKGNLILNNSSHGITIDRASNLTVIGNTCVSGDMDGGGLNSAISIGLDQTTGTHVVKNNVTHVISVAGTPTSTNNHTVSRSTLAYSAIFNGTAFNKATISSRSAALTAYAMKVGGALDQAVDIGAVGSGYVDFDARTLNGAME